MNGASGKSGSEGGGDKSPKDGRTGSTGIPKKKLNVRFVTAEQAHFIHMMHVFMGLGEIFYPRLTAQRRAREAEQRQRDAS